MEKILSKKHIIMLGAMCIVCMCVICLLSMSGYCAKASAYTERFTVGDYTYGRKSTTDTSVTIVESSLTTIADGKLEIPSEVTYGDVTYSVVAIAGDDWNKSAFKNVTGLTEASVEVVIPDSIKELHDYAFANCKWVGKITFGENPQLRTIYMQALQYTRCTELTLPDTVTEVSVHAFNGTSNLKNVYFGKNVQKIESTTFSGTADDLTIHIPASAPLFTNNNATAGVEAIRTKLSVYGDYQGVSYKQIRGTTTVSVLSISDFNAATRTEVIWPEGQKEVEGGTSRTDTIFEIPSTVTLGGAGEYTVTKIEGYAYPGDTNTSQLMKGKGFYDYRGVITKVILPETVTEIGECAFYGFGSGSNVSEFRINLPRNLTKMGQRAFQACSYLKTINIPGTLEEIPYAAFAGCVFAKEVIIGDGVKKIGSVAFLNCGTRAAEVNSGGNVSLFVFVPSTVTNLTENTFNTATNTTKFYTNSDSIKATLEGKGFAVKNVGANYGKSLKLLSVGNSFTRNTMQNLYRIALDQGFTDIELGYFYYPGASLTRHWKMATNDTSLTADEIVNYHYFRWENGQYYDYSMSVEEAEAWVANPDTATVKPSDIFFKGITDYDWDIIDLQLSSVEADVAPANVLNHLDDLITIINDKKTNSAAKYGCLQTWSFAEDNTHGAYLTHYANQGKTPLDQYADIVANSNIIKTDYADSIEYFVPSGTAIQNIRTTYLGDNMNADGYHLNTLGGYVSSMAVLKALTGVGIDDVTYFVNSDVSADNLSLAAWAVNNAVATPLAVTESDTPYKVTVNNDNTKVEISALYRAYAKPIAVKANYVSEGVLNNVEVIDLKHGDNTIENVQTGTKLFIWEDLNSIKPLSIGE